MHIPKEVLENHELTDPVSDLRNLFQVITAEGKWDNIRNFVSAQTDIELQVDNGPFH